MRKDTQFFTEFPETAGTINSVELLTSPSNTFEAYNQDDFIKKKGIHHSAPEFEMSRLYQYTLCNQRLGNCPIQSINQTQKLPMKLSDTLGNSASHLKGLTRRFKSELFQPFIQPIFLTVIFLTVIRSIRDHSKEAIQS